MSKFEPNTTVYFCRTGIDDANKPYFDPTSGAENPIVTWMLENGARVATATNYSFQRTDGRLRIAVGSDECDYDTLLNCDTIVYKNQGVSLDAMWIVGNISQVQWINPNNTYVYYSVDYYCTYGHLIDWDTSICFVEREHVKEDWVNNGGECPAFSNMGPEENFVLEPDTPLYYSIMKMFGFGTDQKYAIYSPYGDDGKKASFKSTTQGGILSGLDVIIKNSTGEVDTYLNNVAESDEADLDRIPMIQTIPKICGENRLSHEQITIPLPWLYESKSISGGSEVQVNYVKNVNSIKYRNAKCWSSQFCKLRLMSHEGDVIDYNPQWFGSGRAETTWHVWGRVSAGGVAIASGLQPSNIEMQLGGMDDFIVTIKSPGESPWVGNAYAQWKEINKASIAGRVIQANNSAIGGIIHSIAGDTGKTPFTPATSIADAANTLGGYINRMGQIASTIKQAKASGASVNGGFTESANAAAALGIYGFQLVAYIVQPYIMNSVDDFFDIYGYNVNRVKTPERNTRKLWNYVKTHNAHVSGAKLSYTARLAIEQMLNNGVTFWNGSNVNPEGSGGITIGDYSKENRETNRAIGG